jgi:hypothetical protein
MTEVKAKRFDSGEDLDLFDKKAREGRTRPGLWVGRFFSL